MTATPAGTPAGPGRMLRTPRLVLTPVCTADVEPLHRHWNEPAVGRHLWDGGPLPLRTVEEVVAGSERDFARAGYGIWALRRSAAGPVLGTAGLRQVDRQVELLFSLDPGYRGRGLATEAARAVLDDALCVGGVVAFTDADNHASQCVLARLGMVPSEFGTPWVRWRLGR